MGEIEGVPCDHLGVWRFAGQFRLEFRQHSSGLVWPPERVPHDHPGPVFLSTHGKTEGDQLQAITARGLHQISLCITTPETQGEHCGLLG